MSPLPLRADFNAPTARSAARRSKDGPQARRLLALAAIYDGATRTEASQDRRSGCANCSRLGDEVQCTRPGRPFRSQGARAAVPAQGRASSGVGRRDRKRADPCYSRRCPLAHVDLCQWLYEEFRVTVSKQTLSRELRGMGYRKLSARPRHHAQAEGAIESFKKPSRPEWRKLRGTRASIQPI